MPLIVRAWVASQCLPTTDAERTALAASESDHDVVAGAAVEDVAAGAADQHVVARAAEERVVAGTADEHVVAVAAVEREQRRVGGHARRRRPRRRRRAR